MLVLHSAPSVALPSTVPHNVNSTIGRFTETSVVLVISTVSIKEQTGRGSHIERAECYCSSSKPSLRTSATISKIRERRFNMTAFPVRFFGLTSRAALLASTVPGYQLFEDSRFRAMADEKAASEGDDSSLRLAGFAAGFGQYMVSAMGRFDDAELRRPAAANIRSTSRFRPLNIHIKLATVQD